MILMCTKYENQQQFDDIMEPKKKPSYDSQVNAHNDCGKIYLECFNNTNTNLTISQIQSDLHVTNIKSTITHNLWISFRYIFSEYCRLLRLVKLCNTAWPIEDVCNFFLPQSLVIVFTFFAVLRSFSFATCTFKNMLSV